MPLRKLAELFRPITVPDYVQWRRVRRQEDGLPLYPGLDFLEAQEAFERDRQVFEEACIQQERDRRLQRLAEHYGVEQVSSLRDFEVIIIVKKGRPNTWNPVTQYELWFEIRQLFKSREFSSLKHACDYLARQEKWVTRISVQSGRSIAANLFEHYMRAQKMPLVQFVEWLCSHPNLANYDGDIAAEFMAVLLSDN